MKVIHSSDFLQLDINAKVGKVKVAMHELSLTQNILEVALKNAGAKRLVRVNLLVGQFSDESEDSIRFYWDYLTKDTPAQTAELSFQPVAAEVECLACGASFQPDNETMLCPMCQSDRLKLLSGDDVRLDSIDVE